MRTLTGLLAALWLSLTSAPALAHHPGADLDKVMGSKEHYFQAVDQPTPAFALADADGKSVRLSDFADKIVVLHFIYAGCPDICPLHADRIAEIQAMINATPMKEQVQFVTITTDPGNDTPDVLREYGKAHGLDPANWVFLTAGKDQSEDVTRKLAEAYGLKFTKTDDGYQMHAVVTHIIDRGGRLAAKFHGLKFEPVNLVLYVNGLTNNAHKPAKKPEPGWWGRLKGLFK